MKYYQRLLWSTLIALFAIGCSASVLVEDDSLPDVEDVGKIQQSLLSCPRPTGSSGSQTTPILGYISAVHVNSAYSFILDVVFTYNDPGTYGPPVTGYVDFGYGQANFTGSGWAGQGTKITSMEAKAPNSNGCSYGSAEWCWYINGALALKMNQWSSYLVQDTLGTPDSFGNGITKMRGYGNIDPQKFRFYYDNAGSIASRTWTALGPELDECADPD